MNNLLSIIADVKRRPAAAYIERVETALGSSITETQKTAIGAFIEAEQVGGRWNAHGRLYLPIWGNAAANAICLKSLASGTFAGTVTHGAGYVQGDGATGYFNFGVSARTLGLDYGLTNGGCFSALIHVPDTRTDTREFIGSSDSGNRRVIITQATGGFLNLIAYNAAVQVSASDTARRGIYIASVQTSTARYLRRYTNGNVLAYSNASSTSDTSIAPTVNQYALGRNNNGSLLNPTDARLGAYHLGYFLSIANQNAFAGNLETLWETCTGLTLP